MNGDLPVIDPQALTSTAAAPSEVIRQQATTADYRVLWTAVVGLIVSAVVALVSGSLLIWAGKDSSAITGVLTLGATAVGSLATMLVHPPNRT